jgi:hypothetical protein
LFVLLHSPAFAKGWNGMFGAIRGQLVVPAKLRELSIMAIGALNHADYEWAQHEGEFVKVRQLPEARHSFTCWLAAARAHMRTDGRACDRR